MILSGIRDRGSGISAPSVRLTASALAAPFLFLASLILYVVTRSISLDDFDSFNFARALDRFDVAANQPQPPGYPLYVVLGRVVDLFARDHQLALTLLSAGCAAATVVALLAVGRQLDAGWAALPLAVMPLFWLSAGMALSDVPGLAFGTLAVLLLVRGQTVFGLAVTGLTLGVRPQDAIVPAGVLLWCLAGEIRRSGTLTLPSPAAAGVGFVAFLGATLLWLVPLTFSLGGPASAWRIMAGQGGYVGVTDSLLARPLTWANVEARLAEFGSVFSSYFGGPRDGGFPAIVGLGIALVVLVALAGKVRWLALSWLLPYSAFMVLFLRPDDPRKVLPTIPPMLLLLAGVRWRIVGAAACVALAGWFAYSALPLVRTLDSVKSPPEQAAAYVAANFTADDTLVVAGSSFNAIRYRDPGFKTYLLDELDRASVDRELAAGRYRNVVILDKDGYTPPESFVGVDTRTFSRDPLVLPKAATVWLAAFRPLSELRDRDLALPPDAVHIGTPEDVRFVGDGWYRPEQIAGLAARWTDRTAQLRFWTDRAGDAQLQLVGVAFPAGQQLRVLFNGQPVAELSMGTDWAPYNVALPAALFHAGGINSISLEHSLTRTAYDATQGLSPDRRPLAAAYSSFEVTPA